MYVHFVHAAAAVSRRRRVYTHTRVKRERVDLSTSLTLRML